MLTHVQGHTFRADALSHVGPVEDLAFLATLVGQDAEPKWGFSIALNDRRGTNFYVNFDTEAAAHEARGRLIDAWDFALDRYGKPDLVQVQPGGMTMTGSPRQPALG